MIDIEIDDKDFQKSMDKLADSLNSFERVVLMKMADTLLLLARVEVPFREGDLSKSGNASWEGDGSQVAFNTDYASYVHEGMRKDGTRRIKMYSNGRKGKFLEDPLKLNISRWQKIAQEELAQLLQ